MERFGRMAVEAVRIPFVVSAFTFGFVAAPTLAIFVVFSLLTLDPFVIVIVTLPSLFGLAIGAIAWRTMPGEAILVGAGSLLFLYGVLPTENSSTVVTVVLPLGALILGAGYAKLWRRQLWPAVVQAYLRAISVAGRGKEAA